MGAIGFPLLDAVASVAIFAQRNAPGGADAAGAGGIMAFLAIYFLVIALISIPTIVGMWKVFTKAGQPGWAAIIPFYNVWVMNQVARKEPLWFILCIVTAFFCGPLALIPIIVINIAVAEQFGKGAGYGIGLSFLSFIF